MNSMQHKKKKYSNFQKYYRDNSTNSKCVFIRGHQRGIPGQYCNYQ